MMIIIKNIKRIIIGVHIEINIVGHQVKVRVGVGVGAEVIVKIIIEI